MTRPGAQYDDIHPLHTYSCYTLQYYHTQMYSTATSNSSLTPLTYKKHIHFTDLSLTLSSCVAFHSPLCTIHATNPSDSWQALKSSQALTTCRGNEWHVDDAMHQGARKRSRSPCPWILIPFLQTNVFGAGFPCLSHSYSHCHLRVPWFPFPSSPLYFGF